MDIESDDSERWEDFFGSSTELAPSLLGIYDTWTSALESTLNESSSTTSTNTSNDIGHNCNRKNNSSKSTSSISNCSNKSSSNSSLSDEKHCCDEYTLDTINHSNDEGAAYEHKVCELVSVIPLETELAGSYSRRGSTVTLTSGGNISTSSLSSPTFSSISQNNSSKHNSINRSRESIATITSSGSGSSKHRNNIRILSPNVQRIITHSDAEPVDTVDIDALQQHLQSPVLSPVLQHRYTKKLATPTNGHKVKLSHIPLSKTTGKLTQSGSDLVETFDSSSEYLDALSFTKSSDKKSSKGMKKLPTPAIVAIPYGMDEEKTPTNNVSPFNFDSALNKTHKLTLPKSESLEGIQLIEMEKLAATSQLITAAAATVTLPIYPKEFVATEPLSPIEIVEAINYTMVSHKFQKLTLNDAHKEDTKTNSLRSVELIEAINNPLISKPLVRSSSAACASTVAGSPLLTYARSKSLAVKANTLGGPVPIKLPTAQQLEELEEASKMSAESLDRLTDIKSKFSPKESRKLTGLMLLEKHKHRPLSSSSICSISSSSSSGSDQLNGKLATSYLASVESLADQSENELMDPHSGMSVFERACMEFVESERSYVEDLGQVKRGYLLDWKERACLSYDELRILFSNIEEIYDFNSKLLKQLINSGMDPVKIAKCFIDLRERFDVYTTYCTSYPEAISLLTKLLQATHTNALLTSTQKMLQHTLPLGSYLLKPVQRILKYHLLLDNLRKHCDVKEVFQAYEIMRQVARNIDQVKRKLEQQSRVKELSGILDGWLGPELTVLGELRQEGLLMEHNKPRMVFLFGTMFIITKPKEDNRLQFKSYIHQNNLMLSEHLPGEPTSFYVIPYDEPRNQIKLTAKNRDQKRLWAQHIKGVILEKFDNIPNRAKELVYKLGDEEDRTPDKNTWKWSLHSTSTTPVYLERRNQYRRSEIRNRSKFKRKTVANSASFDSFNEIAEVPKESSSTKPTKPLSRKNSLDDNMLPALQKLAAAVKNKTKHEATIETNGKSDAPSSEEKESVTCILRDQRSSVRNSTKSPIFSSKLTLKERSKSVPRISFHIDDDEEQESLHGSNTNLNAQKSKSQKSVEVKQYNHKTIPKRIATLKKQRNSKKETSKFYMDLSEFGESTTTVLKITESTENLIDQKNQIELAEECKEDAQNAHLRDVAEINGSQEMERVTTSEVLTPTEKAKKDAQIILDLLKNNKEFERIYKKPQKKRSVDNTPTSPESQDRTIIDNLPPRPPSRSPPPLESESEVNKQPEEEEPIYESLLRNVHVPYKFSPLLGRSKSAHHYKQREKKLQQLPRPESDYVTLVYSLEGELQKVGDEHINREPQLRNFTVDTYINDCSDYEPQRDSTGSSSSSTTTLKRESQNTIINVECSSSGNISQLSTSTNSEAIYSLPMPMNLMKRLLSSSGGNKSSLENISSSHTSLLPRARKSIDNITLAFARSNKPPERRVSDVSEMCRQSILRRQGSEAVGERMAHVDYADPKTLFSIGTTSEASLQRDSVFSLTSSNDSVCDHKRSIATSTELCTNFEYEDDVEASLENDFRDSAIYSDDNEKRIDYEISDGVKRPSSPPPPPPPRNRNSNPQVPPKPAGIPPLLSTSIKSPTRQTNSIPTLEETAAPAPQGASVIMCQSASRSWVLQQIENFNK